MGGDVAGVWEVDAVATHLGHDVLAEQDDLLEEGSMGNVELFSCPSLLVERLSVC